MPKHPVLAVTRLGVATGEEYAAAGWTPSGLRHAIRKDRAVRIAAGRFAPPPPAHLSSHQTDDLALARLAVAATIPADRVAVSHLAGAYVCGLPFWAPDPRACITTWDPKVCRVTGLHVHHVADTTSLRRRAGVPVTCVARTVVDIAAEFGAEAALVTADAAARAGVLSRERLSTEVARGTGRRGIAAARAVVDLLDSQAESPLESRGRWHAHHHGLPVPYSQVTIRTLDGRFLGRVDHYWEEGVVGEADGLLKYQVGPDALRREKIRQQAFEDVDLEVARWGARDLRDFTDAAGRVERARHRRRRRIAAGESPRWIATSASGLLIPVAATT